MQIEHFLAFNLALLAAILSPGPAFLISVQTTLASGRRAGVALGLGLSLMASIWTLAALLGLQAIFAIVPWAYLTVKTIGALYLLYIAYQMWANAREPLRTDARPAKRAFRTGVLINMLNPKSVLFAAAVLVVVLPKELTMGERLFIAGNQLAVEIAFYTTLAFAMSRRAVSKAYLAAKSVIDRMAGAVLGVLGVKLLAER